jgi:hypothetical protein
MQNIVYLTISKNRRLYNSRVLKALEKANVPYTLQSTKYGKRVLVEDKFSDVAYTTVLGIPLI